MITRSLFFALCFTLAAASMGGCATSEVVTYSTASPAEIADKITLEKETNRTIYKAPRLNTRAGFGEFSAGMLSGGANFSSAIWIEGEKPAGTPGSHWLITEVVYTNLGGIYRDYDRAGIEGIAALKVIPVSKDRHYNINSVNMTEIIKVEIAEAELRTRETSGFVLRLMDDSDNLVEYSVPANYIGGYLRAYDNDATRASE
jgi:hypothetical protein